MKDTASLVTEPALASAPSISPEAQSFAAFLQEAADLVDILYEAPALEDATDLDAIVTTLEELLENSRDYEEGCDLENDLLSEVDDDGAYECPTALPQTSPTTTTSTARRNVLGTRRNGRRGPTMPTTATSSSNISRRAKLPTCKCSTLQGGQLCSWPPFLGMPSMSHRQRGEHPWEGGHTDPSEAQGRKRKRPSERSVERDPRADEQKPDMRRSPPGRASQ